MKFSDGEHEWRIPQEYVDADYFINIACLKTHDSGGITLAAKNHQGSVLQDGAMADNQSAWDMHYALPDHDATDGGHHRYRHLVDYMGHEQLGGKTLLVIIDGIWAGKSWEGWVEKWQMDPFENDYPNSMFFSQDLVAVESVCFDFLLEEYADEPDENEKYPYMGGTEDYLLQAADPDNWPAGVSYDPEGDGSILGSLGVYEHWANPTDKSYTTIDFVKVLNGTVIPDTIHQDTTHDALNSYISDNGIQVLAYPNPANEKLFVEFSLDAPSTVSYEIYDISSRLIITGDFGMQYKGSQQFTIPVSELSTGQYLLIVKLKTGDSFMRLRKKIQIQ
jgi:hypothetical protein